MNRFLITLFSVMTLAGCAALPDTTLGHRCGLPDGVGCMSTQEVYDRAINEDLPGFDRVGDVPSKGKPSTRSTVPRQPSRPMPPGSPVEFADAPNVLRASALYSPPEELRIWVNRWRDTEGDLHDESFVYVLVGEGQWLVRD